ncbi:PREDICTED: uncharacterized protein LOC109160752 [Ipomoea nil]|uniref:uncharacterized protein LOC109160752 n=1 Tax=Ipomoea nil TaxID=35883 RepID=UPI0009016738|nr:PREDICTED: uncharacterized protein LOC109160752 [Ipomoea nil]
MAAVWQPAMGVTMRQLQPQRFLIRFYHETDLNRILADGPWTYEQNLLILHKLHPGEDPEVVPLNQADFWVQIHSLPAGLRSEVVVSAIGSFLGTLVQADEKNFGGSMRTFYRVRVTVDVTRPLRKQMKLRKGDGQWAVVDFRYECLPTFCFICGVIGHGDKVCPKIAQGVDPRVNKPYGAWLRAGTRKNVPTVGQRWLAPELDDERKEWKPPGWCDDVATTSAKASGSGGTDVVLVDPKRKRVDMEGMEYETEDPMDNQTAGLAAQARRAL